MTHVSRLVEVAPEPIASDWAHQLPAAVLVFDVAMTCRFATDRARLLFPTVEPLGLTLTTLFSEWLTPPAIGRDAVSVIYHADGRMFRCEASQGAGTGASLVLTDISTHVRDAERRARDSLTGLMLRGVLKERLAEIIALTTCEGTGAAVHYIDLDRFKQVNDTLGHPIGDLLLVKVAERLRSTLEGGDIAARLGGDEFVVVQCRAENPEAVQSRAARLTDLIGRTYVVQGHMLNIGASVGIALCPADGADAESLLRHADLALYRAKADGRGVARFFEPAMNARMQARRLLEADLRRALARRQFRLNFQPLVNLAADRISGFEALIRWHHPERGLVPPAEFIPLAEEIGLITQIGEWVLRTACKEAASWPTQATVAVNISPLQFKNGKLANTVISALAQANLSPERLELEITESALLDETNLVLKTLHTVRDLGVRVSMDDFGTGYSSLSYLRKFPFDKIKIDQSFVKGLGSSSDCDAILRAVANLGASLGMRTTAEGVETSDQLARIRAEGCTEVQGYLTGRPLSADDVTALLNEEITRGSMP
jgi:diguanylate cyclase (GGDEF)-like protein